MCGIAGVFHLDGKRDVSGNDLKRMTDVIRHRGPDDEGFFVGGPVGFGVRRLSIVDRALGHQPLSGEDGQIWIAFNGEIYNHPDLRETLMKRGHSYRSNCDTETVVHAYEEYGEKMVNDLRGMFAFALWDARRKRLLLYRDRLGIKPLYYCQLASTLVFSSEVKALLEYGVPFGVDERVLECYLRLGYVPGERTLFSQVYKLPPGHYLVAQAGQATVQVQRYWSPFFVSAEDRTEAAYLEEFDHLLDEIVTQHRLGEVPQGIYLSGGVDSSSLLAITAGQVSEPVMTFSVGYREQSGTGEFPYARRVAELYRARLFEYELSGQNFAASLPKLIWHMDEPVADPAAIPLFFLSQLAREHITVVQSGEGADEILAGYSIYRKMQRISLFQERAGMLAGELLAETLGLPVFPYKVRRYAELMDKPLPQRYYGVRRMFSEGLLHQMAKNGFPSSQSSLYRSEVFERLYRCSQGYSELNKMLFVDLQAWLPDDLLVKADKMTMAASIELRVPFLDHHLVEFAARLPAGLKLKNGQTKYLLKRLMHDRLPEEILHAPKRGFPVPLSQWLRGELYSAARSWILDSRFLHELFVRGQMERLLEWHRRGRADLSAEIYGMACLAIWHDLFGRVSMRPE